MDAWLQEIVKAVLTPVIAAGLAALGLWQSERRKDRNASHHRKAALADEKDRVAYLKLWLEADNLLGDSGSAGAVQARAEVRRQLAESRTRLNDIELSKPREDGPSALLRAWRRAALIPLKRPAARAVRWVYWFVIIIGLMYLTAMIALSSGMEEGPVIVVVASVLVSLPLLAMTLPLAHWAKSLERNFRPASAPASSAPPQRPFPSWQPGLPSNTLSDMPSAHPRVDKIYPQHHFGPTQGDDGGANAGAPSNTEGSPRVV